MLRILLINDTAKKVGRLKAALSEAGFEVIDESGLTIDLPGRVETVRPDVILIDTESPSRDVMEQVVLVSRDQPRPIVMFTDEHDPGVMRQAIKSGVSAYIVEGIQVQRLQPILDVAMARFESDQALRAQLQARDQQLDLYREAASAIGVASSAEQMRSSQLIDGKIWDGSDPTGYARSFKLHAMSDSSHRSASR